MDHECYLKEERCFPSDFPLFSFSVFVWFLFFHAFCHLCLFVLANTTIVVETTTRDESSADHLYLHLMSSHCCSESLQQ